MATQAYTEKIKRYKVHLKSYVIQLLPMQFFVPLAPVVLWNIILSDENCVHFESSVGTHFFSMKFEFMWRDTLFSNEICSLCAVWNTIVTLEMCSFHASWPYPLPAIKRLVLWGGFDVLGEVLSQEKSGCKAGVPGPTRLIMESIIRSVIMDSIIRSFIMEAIIRCDGLLNL